MQDAIRQIYGSTIQHGHHNDRIYIMHLDPDYIDFLIPELENLARSKKYGKIFAKIPAEQWGSFRKAGYLKEAEVPFFFSGEKSCCFVSRFFAGRQKTNEDFSHLRQLLEKKLHTLLKARLHPSVKKCTASEAKELAVFYRYIFNSYPFPLSRPSFLLKSMQEKSWYYCIRENSKIVAAAAAEIAKDDQYAEMTDFATSPTAGGKGLATKLLRHMEKDLEPSGVKTVFTIARAGSYGMNKVFQKCGFTYSGLLINNTHIGGQIESMTVWHKHLFTAISP